MTTTTTDSVVSSFGVTRVDASTVFDAQRDGVIRYLRRLHRPMTMTAAAGGGRKKNITKVLNMVYILHIVKCITLHYVSIVKIIHITAQLKITYFIGTQYNSNNEQAQNNRNKGDYNLKNITYAVEV